MGPDFDLGDGFVEEMLDGVVIEEVRLLGVLRRAAARHFLVIFVLSPLGFGAVFGVLRFGFLSVKILWFADSPPSVSTVVLFPLTNK